MRYAPTAAETASGGCKCTTPGTLKRKAGALVKTIDSVMRECYAYRHPVKRMLDTKWILKLIEEEARGLLAEKQAAEDKKVSIDYSQLAKIRRDAAVTQDKLIVEEEAWKPNRIQPRKWQCQKETAQTPLSRGVPTAPVPPVRQGLWLGARLGLMLSRSGGQHQREAV